MPGKSKKKKKPAQKRIEQKPELIIGQKADGAAEPQNGTSRLIRIAIIAGTFVSMAALSIFSQDLNGGWPSAGVIGVRFGLLSILSAIYFLMLNITKLSRKGDVQQLQPGKK